MAHPKPSLGTDGALNAVKDEQSRPKMSRKFAAVLAQRASLGRLVSIAANERSIRIVFDPMERVYYVTPLQSSEIQHERFVFSGSAPMSGAQRDGSGSEIVPTLMIEAGIELGLACFQRTEDSGSSWIVVDDDVMPDQFLQALCRWYKWNEKLTSVFAERLRSSFEYLTDAYAENRPCPTRNSDYITWEQSIVEGTPHPLHRSRMPLDPRTQPTSDFDFKAVEIAFMAVQRGIVDMHGAFEEELQPLLMAAGVDALSIDASEIAIPVHEFQIPYLLSLPEVQGKIRLLPGRIRSLAQSSTRTVTVPSLPGVAMKLALSIIIAAEVRRIDPDRAYTAVRYWTGGMLDPQKVVGFAATPLEILPETAFASALGGNLAVIFRSDPRGDLPDVGYALAGALCEMASPGRKGSVAESAFGLTNRLKRLDFLRRYLRLYFRCFLRPLFCNGFLIYAHGQNAVLRFSRLTGDLLGFAARDLSDGRFHRPAFERTTGIQIEERMSKYDMSVVDLMYRAFFVIFTGHLASLVIALDLLFAREDGSGPDSKGNESGLAVIAQELRDALDFYENLPGESEVAVTARQLAAEARRIWLGPTWRLQSYISKRMRPDWVHFSDDVSLISYSLLFSSLEDGYYTDFTFLQCVETTVHVANFLVLNSVDE